MSRTNTNIVELDYECCGAGSPLVFLHGLTFDRSTWEPIVERLTDRFTCIAVDLPGHGTAGSAGPRAGLDGIAAAISALLDELGVEPPVVIGHSMGGALASIYAARYRTQGLVIVDQAPYVRPFATMVHQMAPGLSGDDFATAFEPIRRTIGVELLPEPLRTAIRAGQRIEQDLVLGYWAEIIAATPEELQARIDAETSAISVPVLGVFGQTLDATTRDHLLGHLPAAEIEEWPGLGHMVHLMAPERFARRLATFAAACFPVSAA